MSKMICWGHAHSHDDCQHNCYWLVARQELPTSDFVKVREKRYYCKDGVQDAVDRKCSQESAIIKISEYRGNERLGQNVGCEVARKTE